MPKHSDRLAPSATRRRLLAVIGAGSVAGVAGCVGDGGDGGDGSDGSGSDGGDGSDGSDGSDGGDGSGGDGGTEDASEGLPEVELLDSDGNQAQLTLFYDQGSQLQEEQATQIQRDLGVIGVDVQLEGRANLLAEDFASEPLPDENPDDFEYGPAGRNAGPPDRTRTVADWDMLIGIRANSYPRTPGDTETFWVRDSPVNAYGYVPEADNRSLYEQFRSETDPETRQEILDEIMGNLTVEVPANFLVTSLDHFGFREDINTDPAFNEFGDDRSQITRYRNDQSVSGDFVQLTTTPLGNVVVPEVDDANSDARISLLSDGSYEIGPDNEIIPLFMDIEDSGDGQVYVCTLRDNLQFGTDAEGNSYGQMTAEDWVFQIEMVHGVADDAGDMWDEELPPSEALDSYSVVENVEQTGTLEFQLELAEVDPSFPLRPIIWADHCLPRDLYEQYAPDTEAFRQSEELRQFTWTGNLGPYEFQDRTPGVTGEFTAARNDDYYMREHTEDSNVQVMDDAWADSPYFETYQFDVEEETATVNERFRAGEGDLYGLPSDFIEEVQQAVDDARVEEQRQPFISMLFFNQRSNGHPLARRQEGRQAMARVIDKNVIAQNILRGFAEPAVTFQPTWSQWYNEDAVNVLGIDITEDDIREARDLVDGLEGFTLEEV